MTHYSAKPRTVNNVSCYMSYIYSLIVKTYYMTQYADNLTQAGLNKEKAKVIAAFFYATKSVKRSPILCSELCTKHG